jgi:phenylpropionate dioxygenase-like ring-hydroxylating dioxygenase large terminal subunit
MAHAEDHHRQSRRKISVNAGEARLESVKQIEIIERLLGYIHANDTARSDAIRFGDVNSYLSSEIWNAERAAFFDSHPLVAALSCDLKAVGDYITQDMMGTPVLIVRGKDGLARAFYNVCRHRGATLVCDRSGTSKAFSCPFHAWTYNTEGGLLGVSRSSSFGAASKDELGLIALPCVERYGLIWVGRTPGEPIDIDSYLGGLGPELASWGLETLIPFEEEVFESRTNWKVALDTFGETYHLEALHKNTLGPVTHSNVHCYDPYGRNHRIIFAGRNIEALEAVPQASWEIRPVAVVTYYLFPNTELVLAPNGTVSLVRLFPDPHDIAKTRTSHASYLGSAPLTDDDIAAARLAVNSTTSLLTDEDYAMAESVQRGLESGAQSQVLYGRNEPGVQHFHESFRAGVGLPSLKISDGRE